MTIRRVNPTELAPPSGFSHAVVTTERCTVWLAGQTGMGADGRIIDGDIVDQFEQAMRNLLSALSSAGGSPDDLVSLTIYIVDIPAYRARSRDIGAVWRRLVGTEYPATAGIGVARLWDEQALVEVQGAAAIVCPA